MKQFKHYSRLLLCLAAILFVGTSAFAEVPPIMERIQTGGANHSMSELTTFCAEVESLGSNDPALYLQAGNRLGAFLEPFASTNAAGLEQLERLCEYALAMKCPTNPATADVCIKTKLEIARRLERACPASVEDARVLAGFLGEVRTIMITNYQWIDVYMNIGPPIAPTNSRGIRQFTFSGMDPRTITDPKARAAYERAIAENERHNCENTLQTDTIVQVNYAVTELFIRYTKGLFAHNPLAGKETGTLADAARLTAEEVAVMRSPAPSPDATWYWQHSPR